MTITLRIPTNVGNTRAPVLIKKGQKVLGVLSSKPEAKKGKFVAGKFVLVARDHELVQQNPGDPGMSAHFFTNGLKQTIMEVRYGAEVATYRLYEDRVVYSDGPPHPDHLQLGVRTSASGGVAEPEG